MIKEIRDYIKVRIYEVDTNLVQNDSAFYDGDIGENLIDRSYQIVINNIVNQTRNSHRENIIDIVISIFGYGYRDEVAHYDELLDKALMIQDNILCIRNFSGIETITNIESNGINATQLPDDNNGFKIDINFTLTNAYIMEE